MKIKNCFIAVPLLLMSHVSNAWNTPAVGGPTNGGNGWVGQTFDWSAVASSNAYQIEIDTLPTFNSPVLQRVTKTYINSSSANSDTQHNFGNLYFGKTYYWHVRAFVSGDTSTWSTSFTFLTRDYVTMSSPATAASTWSGLTLDWATHTGVSYYDMQCDTSPLFNSSALRTSTDAYINSSSANTDTDEYLNGLYFGTTYYWRVRARNSVDTTTWTSPWTFVTRDYVTQTSPVIGAQTWTGVMLDWAAHPGAGYYDMQCDTSPLFNSVALRTSSDSYINTSSANTDTDEYLNGLYFGTNYYWRIRVRNAIDTTPWSTVWTFTTRDDVVMNSPAAAAQTWTGLSLDWSMHAGVSFYDMQCDTSPLFNSNALRTSTDAYINTSSANTDTDEYLNNLYFGTTYYWRVRARNAVDSTPWMAAWTFTTRDYVNLNTPANGQLNVNPAGVTLDWLSHAGVGTYQVQWDSINLYNSPVFLQANRAYINTVSSNTDTQNSSGPLATNRVYFWRVRAWNAVDTSEWTERWFSTGTATPVIPAVPALISPVNNAVSQPLNPTLTWGSAANATSYEYQYATNSTFSAATTGTSATTTASISALSQSTSYWWRVRAVNGNIVSAWTTAWRFSTTGPLAAPSLISPFDLSTGISVAGTTFTWTTAANAISYEYEYSTDNTFMTSVVSGTSVTASIASGTFSSLTTYYWRIRATDGSTFSPWTSPWSFTTELQLAAPSLISPADMSTGIVNVAVPLDWNDVVNAITYDYEYSTSPTFSSNVVSGSVTNSDFTTPALNPLTTYYWHVRAVNGSVVSAWSATWSFTTDNTTSISDQPKTVVNAYPNPASTEVFITEVVTGEHYTLHDGSGRKVASGIAESSLLRIDLSELSAGVYTLRIVGQSAMTQLRIIKL